jgi:GAF domain-containing protein
VRIAVGQGLCGAAAAEEETIVVDDVHADSRYLACFAGTRSEIVVPIFAGGTSEGPVIGEIDVDSNMPAAFGHEERAVLERVAAALGRLAPPILAASQEPS